MHWLHRIFCMAWESGTVPAEWRKAQIGPVDKKGSIEHNVRTIGELAY